MSIRLYLVNLRLSRLALLAWPVFLGSYAVLVVYLYPSISDATNLLDQLGQLPVQVRAAIGLPEESIEELFPNGEFSFNGALTTHYLIWWPVFVGIYAVIYGGGVISREIEQGTLRTLLSQPLHRYKFLLSKSAAFVSIIAILWVVSWGFVMATAVIRDIDVSTGNVAIAHTIGWLLVLTIFSYSVLMSSVFLRSSSALAMSYLVTFVFYMLNFMAPAYDSIDWLENISIFHFYQPLILLEGADVNWAGLGVYGGIIIGSHLLSIIIFQRRDIQR